METLHTTSTNVIITKSQKYSQKIRIDFLFREFKKINNGNTNMLKVNKNLCYKLCNKIAKYCVFLCCTRLGRHIGRIGMTSETRLDSFLDGQIIKSGRSSC